MNILIQRGSGKRRALTLIELLVVIIVIFVLVTMLMPGSIHTQGRPAKIVKARTEVADLLNSINAYQAEYGHYPMPTNGQATALTNMMDITYGGPLLDAALKTGAGTPVNAEVVAILMDMEKTPAGAPTVNNAHALNPKQIKFLNAKISGDNTKPGVGNDMIYRDPWGKPYIISMDLSGDDRCLDAFYRKQRVSLYSGALGFDGLANFADTNGASDSFEIQGRVMVWSFGPDGEADATKPANVPPNKDNVLSWK